MTRKLIILTDPGQDQAAAILMILGQRRAFDVLGLVATAGNINLDYTIANCLKLMELAGRPDIPVFSGCPHPIIRPLVMAEHVHGPTGLDGPDLPQPKIGPQEKHGVDFIIDTVRAHPREITICSLSPVTNLAMALRKAPDIASKIHEVVAMLGAYFEVGNITPTAEFNCYVDPEAADIVLRAGIRTTLLPLDVTHRMRSTPERLGAMRALGNRCGVATAEMLEFSEAFDLRKYGWEGAPLHGPCVPAFMLAPQMFSGRQINVSVELNGTLTSGMTVADWWQITDRPKNVFYVTDGDPVAYYDLLLNSLENLP
ncbi:MULTISPECIES: nucleoside hydrolase [unclassified Ensifer]|uniref:nucleoside hydrolase n=1 Tax=unclassified Ensifer TaxID=2633371 RepID=UPI00070A43E5|nr:MULTISPECIES: nucleoside hydrolase [unclassified Ensifer]KQW50479.1 nucleoside hydrolase [Ensifer sp. Root1252]KRC74703.1 nucleoside hydrolase [Ensifer sp. Root231]KRC94789.1 nucleoside hydrolase [Ensifer sp. Root258]